MISTLCLLVIDLWNGMSIVRNNMIGVMHFQTWLLLYDCVLIDRLM